MAAIATGTPYSPQHGSTYHFEAQHSNAVWPECNYRFLSYTSTCDALDLWQGAGVNQEITLLATGEDGANAWRLETNCGLSIGYSKNCGNTDIVTGSTQVILTYGGLCRLVISLSGISRL